MMDTDKSPRLCFKCEEGQLYVRTVRWWKRPMGDDSHFTGSSHWQYGDWVPVRAVDIDGENGHIEVVVDKLIELIAIEDKE